LKDFITKSKLGKKVSISNITTPQKPKISESDKLTEKASQMKDMAKVVAQQLKDILKPQNQQQRQ